MLNAQIAVLLGGRSAEWAIFKDMTTGAKSDIERATTIARKMVCDWGMSEEMGPLSFGRKEEQIFLGREISQHRDYSEQTAILIDKEVRRVIDQAGERATGLIDGHIEQLKDLANVLLEREVLDGDEIEKVLKGEKLGPPREWQNNKPKGGAASKPAAGKPASGEPAESKIDGAGPAAAADTANADSPGPQETEEQDASEEDGQARA